MPMDEFRNILDEFGKPAAPEPFDLILFSKNTIAAAVAREVRRIEVDPAHGIAEGSAYKAAWDRAGSDATKHIDAFVTDCTKFAMWARVQAVFARHAGVRGVHA